MANSFAKTGLIDPKHMIYEVYRVTDSGEDNVAHSLSLGKDCILREVRIHLSAAGGDNSLTITLNNATSQHDVVIFSQDMTSATDVVWRPTDGAVIDSLDSIDFAWTNGSSRNWGITVVIQTLA